MILTQGVAIENSLRKMCSARHSMSILHEKILDQKQQMDSFPGEYIAE
jgi:hypothetical protein